MKRKHAMPFGAELIDGGGVRFRLTNHWGWQGAG